MINFGANKMTLQGRIHNPYFNTSFAKSPSMATDEIKKGSFSDVLGEVSSAINKDLDAPDKLLADVVNGSGNADVHDVTVAMAKAEMTVSLATQITSKVIQAYEKISQIAV